MTSWLSTSRLELLPLDPAAAEALPEERRVAAQIVGAALSDDWPHPDLLDILPQQAGLTSGEMRFGIWLIVERETATVVGDAGFHGPPGSDGTLEIGYSIVPDRRRRGYATEAARALIEWALRQPGVEAVVARCQADNEASIRTLERLAFRRDGRSESQLHWRLHH